jgi:hypothetical protein
MESAVRGNLHGPSVAGAGHWTAGCGQPLGGREPDDDALRQPQLMPKHRPAPSRNAACYKAVFGIFKGKTMAGGNVVGKQNYLG